MGRFRAHSGTVAGTVWARNGVVTGNPDRLTPRPRLARPNSYRVHDFRKKSKRGVKTSLADIDLIMARLKAPGAGAAPAATGRGTNVKGGAMKGAGQTTWGGHTDAWILQLMVRRITVSPLQLDPARSESRQPRPNLRGELG